MRFRKGVRFSHFRRRRGLGRGDPPYTMTHKARRARDRNASMARAVLALRRGRVDRTCEETRRLEIEIALAGHRGETYRAMARRLGLRSHAHCWRVVASTALVRFQCSRRMNRGWKRCANPSISVPPLSGKPFRGGWRENGAHEMRFGAAYY